jgi:hypothetical protein
MNPIPARKPTTTRPKSNQIECMVRQPDIRSA